MRMERIITATVLTLALIIISTTTSAAISCDCGDICVDETGWWRDSGMLNASVTPIQAAVDNATAGETICVKAGSYTENVVIATPHLTLQGEDSGVVIVNTADPDNHVFEVTADYVNISGFNATGSTSFSNAGIYLDGVDHCNISENTVSNNYRGIDLGDSSNYNTLTNNTALNNRAGIYLYSSSNNTLTSNTASNNYYGIHLYSSSNNTLTSNTASNNNSCGIYLYSSSNYNTLTNNTALNNYDGIYLYSSSNNTLMSNNASLNNYKGIILYSFSNNNTLTGNNCSNNNAGIYLGDSSNNTLVNNTASNNYYGIDLYSSNNYNTLTNNTASNNYYGIHLRYSSDYNTLTNNTASNNTHGIYLYSSNNYNTLTNNTALNNKHGIYLYSSSNNTLASNTASSNQHGGIHLYSSSNNTASNNTASNNMRGIYLHSSNNNTLTNNTVNLNSDHGIYLHKSSNNTLTSNTANSNNYDGICLSSSSSNTLTNNTASSNNNRGIYLSSSSDNLIYNNYFNNTNNAYDNTGSNIWNATKTNGTNIIGGPFLGGNYWSDYAGVDNDSDGLGDTLTPYNSSDDIENGGDYHPLVMVDNTPPPGITYLQNITHAQTYINWTWTNPSDPDFNHTELYLNGTFLTNIPAPQNYYNVTGLLPDTSYQLSTRTVDTSGNINLTWVNDTASTLPASGTTLNLYTGWNLISLPLMPEDTSITSLLSPINGNYSIVWEYNASDTSDHWKKYDPGVPFGNDLTNMEPGKGYWILMTSDNTLPISGTVPESTDMVLKTGWNLIGYNSLDSQPVAEALSSISGNYSIVWTYNASDTADHWKKYDPSVPFGNDLTIVEPGKGYWIMMTSEGILET